MNDHTAELVELAKRGSALAPPDRSRLVDMLLVSLHEDPLVEIEAAWDGEVERRLAAFDQGELRAIDGEEALAQAHALARR